MKKQISGFKGKYSFLSNFYSAPVVFEGLVYKNNEAAFQSAKCVNKKDRIQFQNLLANEAKRLGRRVKLRPDWEDIKDEVMYEVVLDKFKRNDNLKEKLLDTANAELIEENWWNDTYWGVCKGKGKNKLGKILMKVRDELKYCN